MIAVGIVCFVLGMATAAVLLIWSCEAGGYERYWEYKVRQKKEIERPTTCFKGVPIKWVPRLDADETEGDRYEMP